VAPLPWKEILNGPSGRSPPATNSSQVKENPMRNVVSLRAALTGLICLLGMHCAVRADDWPHWMGPHRDNIWREDGLLETFPEAGPKILWRTPVAGGYAGPAVSNGRVFVLDFVTQDEIKADNLDGATSQGTERVLCLDESTGEILWKHEYPEVYTISYAAGPRCTPTVDGEHVYTLGAEGQLFCFNVSDGAIRWSKNLKEEYRTRTATWGYASHPLVDGDKLICVVGTDVAHAAAFNKFTGEEIWKTGQAPEQGYCPPVIINAGGERQLILVKPDGIYAAHPETGEIFWESPYNADYGSIIMTPIKIGEHLFLGGFQEKNLLLKLDSEKPAVEVVWKDKLKHGISPVNVQPFVIDDTLFGFHEKGDFRAVQFPSGEILWKSPGPIGGRPRNSATAFLVQQADRFWIFAETGELVIATFNVDGYKEIDRAMLIEPTNFAYGRDVVWCAPAFANKRLYVRNDQECICVLLAAEQ